MRAAGENDGGFGEDGKGLIGAGGANREGSWDLETLESYSDGGRRLWSRFQPQARQNSFHAHPQDSRGPHQDVRHHPSTPLESEL